MGRYYARKMMADRRRAERERQGYDGNRDYGRGYDSEMDGRRGVKGTGRYGIGGSRYYGRDRAYEDDYDDYDYDMPDGRRGVKGTGPYGIGGRLHYRDRAMYDGNDYAGEEEIKLTKKDMREWKENLENADGTDGAHFELPQIEQAAQTLGVQMRGYDIKDLCMAANMLYSDYCKVFEQFIPREKEPMLYTKMAKAFLDDPDASVRGGEKLAAYYFTIVCDDEE